MKKNIILSLILLMSHSWSAEARTIFNGQRIKVESADGRTDSSQTLGTYTVRCVYFLAGQERTHSTQRNCGAETYDVRADRNGVIALPKVESFSTLKNGFHAFGKKNYHASLRLTNAGNLLGELYSPELFQEKDMAVLYVYKLSAKIGLSFNGMDIFASKLTQGPDALLVAVQQLNQGSFKATRRAFFASNDGYSTNGVELKRLNSLDIQDMMYITFEKNKPMKLEVELRSDVWLQSDVLSMAPSEFERLNNIELMLR